VLLHFLFDWLKVNYINKILSAFWAFLLDQFLHLASLTPIFFFDFSRRPPTLSGVWQRWYGWYMNDPLVVFLIGLLAASFAGTFLLYTFKKTFFPSVVKDAIPKYLNYSLVERGVVFTACCIFAWYGAFMALGLWIVRMILRSTMRADEFLLNVLYAAGIGILIRAII
jgi:hypothetical protein